MTSLRRRMTEDMQVRNLSSHTQATYVQQVLLFARHFNKSPEILGPEEIRSYQIYLMNERKLAPCATDNWCGSSFSGLFFGRGTAARPGAVERRCGHGG